MLSTSPADSTRQLPTTKTARHTNVSTGDGGAVFVFVAAMTTDEQDAAVAWRAAQLGIAKDQLLVQFVKDGLADLVTAHRDATVKSGLQ